MFKIEPTRVFDLLAHQLKNTPNINIFSYRSGEEWIGVTTQEFIDKVNAVSKSLLAYGVKHGDRVGLISENRLEWNILDFAIQQVGAVVVAIYPNISDSDYEFILNDAEVSLCFVSNRKLYERLQVVKQKVPVLKDIYTFEKYDIIPHLNSFIIKGITSSNEELAQRKAAVDMQDLATLIYTSGTTGTPKGVMLTHENLMADVISSELSFPVVAYDKALTFLPSCHAYERVFQYVYIKMGLPIYYARSLDTIGDDIASVKPQIFSAVPRVLEKVYEKIMSKGESLKGIKRKLFFWSIKIGEQYDLDESNFSFFYKIKLAIARKLVFSKWQEALGGEIKGIASGSATLPTRLLKLYLAAGIKIYEGYGLTEAGPCLAVNDHKRGMKIGTVGLPLIGIDIKLAPDGEILARGRNIMKGYYKNPEATAEVIKDGWLYTGDIGEWVDGKFLKIIDRKKEMFKTSGGKYVVPQQIESKMSESSFIHQIMVVGEGQKFPSALIVPAFDKFREWLKSLGVSENLSNEDIIKHESVKKKMDAEVEQINTNFGNWERIKRIALIPKEFSIEGGELTPTLKNKRKVIEKNYKELISKIYKQ